MLYLKLVLQSGQADAPSLSVLKNQKLILDTLRERVKLSVDGSEHLSDEEMRNKVDQAVESVRPSHACRSLQVDW